MIQELEKVSDKLPALNRQKQFDYYMKNIYKSRNTIGKASQMDSSYTWKDFNSQELRNIGKNILKR